MRKFIVKHFALGYFIKMFGQTWGAPRASRIIFPLFVITGYFVATNENYPEPTPLLWVLFALTAIAVFFGFVYFRFFPVKYNELDEMQKVQFGQLRPNELTVEEFEEWVVLMDKYRK